MPPSARERERERELQLRTTLAGASQPLLVRLTRLCACAEAEHAAQAPTPLAQALGREESYGGTIDVRLPRASL